MEKNQFTVEERRAFHQQRAKEGKIVNFKEIAKKFKDNQQIEDLLKALMPKKGSSFVKVQAVHALCYALQEQYNNNIGKPVKSKLNKLNSMNERTTDKIKSNKKLENPAVG